MSDHKRHARELHTRELASASRKLLRAIDALDFSYGRVQDEGIGQALSEAIAGVKSALRRQPHVIALTHRRVDTIAGSGTPRSRVVRRMRWYVTLRFGRTTKKLAVSSAEARWLKGAA